MQRGPKLVFLALLAACGPQVQAPDAGARAVAFAADSMKPANGVCVVPPGDLECAPVVFTAGKVLDDDANEKLFLRWFVDGELSGQALLAPTTPPSASRPGGSFTFQPQRFCRGVHVVKAILASGFAPSGPLDRVAEGETSAEWVWCLDGSKCANAEGACQ